MVHEDFSFKRSHFIESLNIEVQEYTHIKTGASHYHLACDYDENVFFLGFRTMPMDSTGVAHILEHTALCGSKQYPVRDPFFMMIRRSLNTFMNAFTSSDWTAYPFASKNKKDFNNLLSVYLDAAFFSRLDPLDFAQEGHRLEFEDPEDPNSPLQFKGVVYNEMKGAMSSVTSQLWQTFSQYLYPTSTYHFNSGGEPSCILDLRYDDLLSFYRKHYHPSNAMFMTFGDIPAAEHHEKIAPYLAQFDKLDQRFAVNNEKRYLAPIRVEESYASKETKAKTHHVLGWLLGESANLDKQLEAHFLSALLLENSSSPLRYELETTELGSGPSPLCGLEDSNKEMCFVCGIEGSEADNNQAFETLVMDTLAKVKETGFSQEQIEAVLHQLELSQREIGGDGFPYGLQLIMSSVAASTHYSDPIALLDLDPALERLRARAFDDAFIVRLIDECLLNNPHRVTLTLKPDTDIEQRMADQEQQRLDQIRKQLSDDQIQSIIDQAKALKQRQAIIDDDSILPKVTREDIDRELTVPTAQDGVKSNLNLTAYQQGTNGLTYHQVITELPELNDEEQGLLPLVLSSLTEVGINDDDYLKVQERQALICGGISAYSNVRASIDDVNKLTAYWVLSGKALSKDHAEFFKLMQDTFAHANFHAPKRLKELLSNRLSRKEQSITGNGHGLAMNIATSGLSGLAHYSYIHAGLPSLERLREQLNELESSPDAFIAKLDALHKKLISGAQQHLLVADQNHLSSAADALGAEWKSQTKQTKNMFALKSFNEAVKEAWVVPSQTNFCSKVYPTVLADHKDSPALSVLGTVLRNGYLHTAIREQGGAYGGGASQDNSLGCFKFYSYRDPRFKDTFEDFDKSIKWFLEQTESEQVLEEAVLGVISSIDKPGSPSGEAKQAFHGELNGRSAKWRNAYRQRVLDVTYADLKRVASTYFVDDKASYGALIASSQKDTASELKFSVKEL
ncbi:insulinase family protein [Bermanella sp. R86510]|uniref:insulinase family protein n=1 Tax=unclassified Bermanella TaxID=2627862 RepID=UPI0037CC4569